jgi:type IV secretion system protein VirD4
MQAFANTAANEARLLWKRSKALCRILEGLTIVTGGGIVTGFIAWVAGPGFLALGLFPLVYGGYLIAIAFPNLFRRSFTDAPGTARWATIEDLKKAKVVGGTVDPAHHLYCGVFEHKKKLIPIHEDSDRHVATLGSTRRGKGNGLLVQALAQINESFVVLDPAGELAAMTYDVRAKKGLVFVLNPFGVLTDSHPHLKSCGYNPYSGFSAGNSNFLTRSAGVGDPIIPRGNVNDAHWDEGSVQLATVIGMWEKWLEKDVKGHVATMRHVMEMLHYPYTAGKTGSGLKGLMQRISAHPDRQMARMATRFISDDPDDREVRGVCSTTAGKVKFLNDETLLADMDKHPTIDGKPFEFGWLKDNVGTVFIILPDDMLRTHALWLRLIVSSAINALKRSLPGRVRVNLLLDEIGNLGYMEPLDTAMGMIAKKGVKVWTVWQSLSQISRVYGEHGRETFLSGVGMLNSFKADDLETAKYLSDRLGRRTEIVKSHNDDPEYAARSKTESASGYPLMHPDQIMTMGPREMLCWIDRLPHPVKLKAPFYAELPWIKGIHPSPYHVPRV